MRISHGHAEEFSFLGYFVFRRRWRGLRGHHAGLATALASTLDRFFAQVWPGTPRTAAVGLGAAHCTYYPGGASADSWAQSTQQFMRAKISSMFSNAFGLVDVPVGLNWPR